ncbi:uncharacterized protein RHIMIDRAFT_102726 [Rhizopus microsporus ATCC 52813]|uniref:Uncharacterized protein n=1 Tax=Rhizopus microsporus ATCC 52813 TaxID=1340429 RepID=A0A2G4T0J9_RHIZD|nr:uncharacterized protein RHIMIDRAFT_102726 [Rhizopus microsporus ATCC 52813]PHZ14545.1 hypothetical protein RHIMIDRAFT_102726 [Rhizopus microsporus ATCC 52813]
MTVNTHPLLAFGDIPAYAKLADQSDHFHLRGYRCCTIKAARIENKNAFFPLLPADLPFEVKTRLRQQTKP